MYFLDILNTKFSFLSPNVLISQSLSHILSRHLCFHHFNTTFKNDYFVITNIFLIVDLKVHFIAIRIYIYHLKLLLLCDFTRT